MQGQLLAQHRGNAWPCGESESACASTSTVYIYRLKWRNCLSPSAPPSAEDVPKLPPPPPPLAVFHNDRSGVTGHARHLPRPGQLLMTVCECANEANTCLKSAEITCMNCVQVADVVDGW